MCSKSYEIDNTVFNIQAPGCDKWDALLSVTVSYGPFSDPFSSTKSNTFSGRSDSILAICLSVLQAVVSDFEIHSCYKKIVLF